MRNSLFQSKWKQLSVGVTRNEFGSGLFRHQLASSKQDVLCGRYNKKVYLETEDVPSAFADIQPYVR